MEELLDVVICDPLDFDELLFHCWLEGQKPEEATEAKIEACRQSWRSRNISESTAVDPQLFELLKLDVIDNYRHFEVLEHYVCQPSLLVQQIMIQIPQNAIHWVIEQYYSIDDTVVREMLGKRFSKNRKDLDEISDSTGVPLRRVTRQFDNLKRIYTSLEEVKQFQCNIMEFIQEHFALPLSLCRKYTCLLYLLVGKFTLVSKKKFQRISCKNLELCAAVTLACLVSDASTFSMNWSCSFESDMADTTGEGDTGGLWSSVWTLVSIVDVIEPDKQLLSSLREVKTAFSGEMLDTGYQFVRTALMSQPGGAAIARKLDVSGRARQVFKGLLQIGGNLSQTREFRDIYEDIMTKIGEPLDEAGLTFAEVNKYLICCNSLLSGHADSLSRKSERIHESFLRVERSPQRIAGPPGLQYGSIELDWVRFVTCVRLCLAQLYFGL